MCVPSTLRFHISHWVSISPPAKSAGTSVFCIRFFCVRCSTWLGSWESTCRKNCSDRGSGGMWYVVRGTEREMTVSHQALRQAPFSRLGRDRFLRSIHAYKYIHTHGERRCLSTLSLMLLCAACWATKISKFAHRPIMYTAHLSLPPPTPQIYIHLRG